RRNTASAAIPERKLATCQLVRSVALIAAPPVEKRAAAARSRRRLPRRGSIRPLPGGAHGAPAALRTRRGAGRGAVHLPLPPHPRKADAAGAPVDGLDQLELDPVPAQAPAAQRPSGTPRPGGPGHPLELLLDLQRVRP